MVNIDLTTIPQKPGVYLFLSSKGTILYVGKAKSLRSRVSSYFNNSSKAIKTEKMLFHAHDIKIIITENEVEAFLLESNLIKTEKPKYNILLKDAKGYPYIKVTAEQFPRIMVARNTSDSNATYFGPFVNASGLRDIVHTLQKIFPLRNCTETKFREKKLCMNYQIKRCLGPCEHMVSHRDYINNVQHLKNFFSGHTKNIRHTFEAQMKSAADSLDFETAALFRDRLKTLDCLFSNQSVTLSGFDKFLDGFVFHSFAGISGVTMMIIRNSKLIGTKTDLFEEELSADLIESFVMQFYSHLRQFPDEFFISSDCIEPNTDIISSALSQMSQKKMICRKKGIKGLIDHGLNNGRLQTELFTQKTEHSYYALQKMQSLFSTENTPNRVECIDISHLSGNFTVGVSIVWENKEFHKNAYRKYKINSAENDDFKSIYEVICRKLERIKSGNEETPDILIIDGGIGQLNAAQKASDDTGVSLNLMGISKGRSIKGKEHTQTTSIESIHIPGRMNPLNLKRHDKLLLFVQKLRDESHRFVIEYSRKLALKNMTRSPLSEIDGIGPNRLKKLLTEFPDIHKNMQISATDINHRCQIPMNIAEKVIEFIQQSGDGELPITS